MELPNCLHCLFFRIGAGEVTPDVLWGLELRDRESPVSTRAARRIQPRFPGFHRPNPFIPHGVKRACTRCKVGLLSRPFLQTFVTVPMELENGELPAAL